MATRVVTPVTGPEPISASRPTHDYPGEEDGVVIALGGDAELTTIIEALNFITQVLDDQRRDIH